ncbi:hypothetical protein [Streptomyces sp. NPDC051452]|uniref:hypothetical protein n=1 Tax=Streptomyces sp. NPDC051452 TaxID=3365654 RepID=UPI0037BB2E6B
MAEEQLPDGLREFASYLNALLARLDPGGGWCAVFWQRDPAGMRACLDGREVPPWDVVEALLRDLGEAYGATVAAAERHRARILHAAALTAYDARPGARDALAERLDSTLRDQRHAVARLTELTRLLSVSATPEEAAALGLDLAWTRDTHHRATARCAELRARMTELDRWSTAGSPTAQARYVRTSGPWTAAHPHEPAPAGGEAPTAWHRDGGSPRDASPEDADDRHRATPAPYAPRADETGGAADSQRATPASGAPTVPARHTTDALTARPAPPAADARADHPRPPAAKAPSLHPANSAQASARHPWPPAAEAPPSHPANAPMGPAAPLAGEAPGRHSWPPVAQASPLHPAGGAEAPTSIPAPPAAEAPPSHPANAPMGPAAPLAADASARHPWPPAAEAPPSRPANAPTGRTAPPPTPNRPDHSSAHPTAEQPQHTPTPTPRHPSAHPLPTPSEQLPATPSEDPALTSSEEPTLTPSKPRKRRRGSARFAGMEEDGVLGGGPQGAGGAPTGGARVPRGARFAGAVGGEPEPASVATVDDEAAEAVAGVVARLGWLRGEGRSGEAHVLLVEAAGWPPARLPLLAEALHRAGLGADWDTLLWEAASLPAERLVAVADALAAAGRDTDGQRMLRQGVARPPEQIGAAVLRLDDEGRAREARALLDAYVRVRTPEEAVRSAAADPGRLVPLLLRAAHALSGERHRDLVHALRVAGHAP